MARPIVRHLAHPIVEGLTASQMATPLTHLMVRHLARPMEAPMTRPTEGLKARQMARHWARSMEQGLRHLARPKEELKAS